MADAVNVSDLDHLWDPKATPLFTVKPPEWVATYLPRYCQSVSDRADSDCRGLALTVRELQREGFWQRIFPDWETCCQALFKRPAAWVEQVVEGVRVLHSQGHEGEITDKQAFEALKTHGGDRRSEAFQAHQEEHADQPSERSMKYGETASYLKARLRRDSPEVADALERGEFRSARAAAIAAGIIRPVPTIRLVDDPTKVAAAICSRTDQSKALAIARAIIAAAGE